MASVIHSSSDSFCVADLASGSSSSCISLIRLTASLIDSVSNSRPPSTPFCLVPSLSMLFRQASKPLRLFIIILSKGKSSPGVEKGVRKSSSPASDSPSSSLLSSKPRRDTTSSGSSKSGGNLSTGVVMSWDFVRGL